MKACTILALQADVAQPQGDAGIGRLVVGAEFLAVFFLDGLRDNRVLAAHAEHAAAMPAMMPGFAHVPPDRWLLEARLHTRQSAAGLTIPYDPALRAAFLAAFDAPQPDLWPLFDALAGLPVALIRGANSDLLSAATAAEMRRRRPDMIFAEVPDRAHIPFLDEPESLAAIRAFLLALA